MHTIGERLEEARKRQGLSIREAAEATKIRSDFLTNMEANLFNFPLPEIYRRGFLRVYATYLKLDPEKLLTDYHAIQLGVRARSTRSYGTLENEDESSTDLPGEQPAADIPEISRAGTTTVVDPNQYWKIAGALVGVLVFVIVLILGTRAIFSGGDTPAPNPDIAAPATTSHTYTFIAKDDITSLRVTKGADVLFNGPLRKNERQKITFEGEVELLCSQVQNLAFEKDGTTYGIPSTGVKRSYLPPRTQRAQ